MTVIVLAFQHVKTELSMTEFYNLVYQYENDCLKAALEYNKIFTATMILNQKSYYLH